MNNQLNGILLFWCPILNFPTFSHLSLLNLSFAFSFYFSIYHLLLLDSLSFLTLYHFAIFVLLSRFLLIFLLFFVVFSDPPSSYSSFRFPSLLIVLSQSFSSSSFLFLFLFLPLPLPYPLSFIHTYLAARTSCSVCNIYLQPHFPAYLALISSNTRRCLNHV